MFGEDHLVIVV